MEEVGIITVLLKKHLSGSRFGAPSANYFCVLGLIFP